jgi:hypothetical protein
MPSKNEDTQEQPARGLRRRLVGKLARKSLGSLQLQNWASKLNQRLKPVPVKKWTGWEGQNWRSVVPAFRVGRYLVINQPIAGDAPKAFVRVYEPGASQRDRPASWPRHIAKVGHKWYPAESITEQLMTRIGECLGLRMAHSQLMECESQIRFLSRYFLKQDESLVHGAEIVAGYVDDEHFVEDVENQRLEKEIFTFQVLCTAIGKKFPAQAVEICLDFVRMIGFDALVGNQDRHLYNWGVIVHAKGRRPPLFSPIYDTARGLFWNTEERALRSFEAPAKLLAYVANARPLVGWDGDRDPNHFQLVARIAELDPAFRRALLALCSRDGMDSALATVDGDFKRLLSNPRRELIKRCLAMRFRMFEEAAKGGKYD